MERIEGPQTPFEVYCHHCDVTFPAGAKRCVHCGGRLAGGGRPLRASVRTADGAGHPPEVLDAGEDIAEPGVGRRLGGAALWILIALGAALSRLCAEG